MNKLYKYPRTPHFPFSLGATDDDKILDNTNHFVGKQVIVTEKMDGENTTIYSDYYHARSLDSKHRDYHSYLLSKTIPSVQGFIPPTYRVCGEYLYAKHSIGYDNLSDYFLAFSIWDNNKCLDWNNFEALCSEWGLHTVPVLYKGIYDEKLIKEIAEKTVTKGGEGIVCRIADSFYYDDFSKNIAKYVRKNHVQTDKHWSTQVIEKNKLENQI